VTAGNFVQQLRSSYIHWGWSQDLPDSCIARISHPWAGSVGIGVGNGRMCDRARTPAISRIFRLPSVPPALPPINTSQEDDCPWESAPPVHHASSPGFPVHSLPSKYFREDARSWESHPSAIPPPPGSHPGIRGGIPHLATLYKHRLYSKYTWFWVWRRSKRPIKTRI